MSVGIQTHYIAIGFAGIITFYARGVGSTIFLADYYHLLPDPFLDEQVLVNSTSNFKKVHFKNPLPDQTGEV